MNRHLAVMLLIAAALSAALTFVFLRIDFVPNPSSLERGLIDHLLQIIFATAGVVFVSITTVFIYAIIFFRRRPGDITDSPRMKGYAPLELAWTVIPLVVVIILSIYASSVMNRMMEPAPPQTELQVEVLAFRFGWQFSYPEYGITSFELKLPVDRRVLFSIQSKDVVHSFWVQEFGPKQDAVPGITTELRITPTKAGQYQVRCSQLCGFGHTYMTAPVQVFSAAEFDRWVKDQQKQSAQAK